MTEKILKYKYISRNSIIEHYLGSSRLEAGFKISDDLKSIILPKDFYGPDRRSNPNKFYFRYNSFIKNHYEISTLPISDSVFEIEVTYY